MQDDDIDLLLAKAAQKTMVPSDALMERVLADALALQRSAPLIRRPDPSPQGFFARLAAMFGGPPALAGLGTAAVFGLALGYYSPATLDYLTGTSADTAEFFPEAEFLTTEG